MLMSGNRPQHIVIVGAGFAGVNAYLELHKKHLCHSLRRMQELLQLLLPREPALSLTFVS